MAQCVKAPVPSLMTRLIPRTHAAEELSPVSCPLTSMGTHTHTEYI